MPLLLLLVLYLACLGGPWPQPDGLGASTEQLIGIAFQDSRSGVRVTDVAPGSPAEEAGLKRGDILLAIDGVQVASAPELTGELAQRRQGARLSVAVGRGSETRDIQLVVKANLGLNLSGILLASFLSWGAMAMGVALALLVARFVRRQLLLDPHQRETILHRYGRFRVWHALSLFALYIVVLYLLGWGWVVQSICWVEEWQLLLPGMELLLLAPLLSAMVLSWFCYYDAERTLYETAHPFLHLKPYWSRPAYVGFHARQNLAMVLVPVIMLVLLQGVFRLDPDLFSQTWFQAVSFGSLVLLVGLLPLVLRVVLGLGPMPAGSLRDRLLRTAKRLRFRCSEIMIWNTRNGVANALVVGVVPWLRYVVLSDRLVSDLSADEVEAVFGHEAGHYKHHHMLYYLGFLFVSLAVLATTFEAIQPYLAEQFHLNLTAEWMTPMLVGSLGTYIFVVFGFLSRRCERQADIFGCRAVSCSRPDCTEHDESTVPADHGGLCPTGIRTFIRALEKVAALNGISRSRPGWLQSWQHSTIDRRVEFLQEMLVDPTIEPRFQRRVGIVKWVMMIALVSLLCVIKINLPIPDEERPAHPAIRSVRP